MIKILQVFSYFQPDFTGEGIYFEKIERLFKSRGICSDVLAIRTCRPESSEKPGVGALSVKYLGLAGRTAPIQSVYIACWLLFNLRRYDIVHLHTPVDRYFVLYLLSALFGVPLIQSCTLDDSPDNVLRSYRPKFRWLVARLLRLVKVFVLISPKLLRGARQAIAEQKLRFIPQGAAVGESGTCVRVRTRRAYGYADDDVVLLFVGGICARKGVDFLVETLPALLAHDDRFRLLVVGPDLEVEYADRLRSRVSELGLEGQVRFTGALYALDSIYQLSDILAFASHQEGFGNVLLEAMAHARPVVSRRLDGVTDYVIAHGETGFLFEDEAQYVSAMRCLVDDRARRQSIGQAGRAAVAERFALSQISDRYIDLYEATVRKND